MLPSSNEGVGRAIVTDTPTLRDGRVVTRVEGRIGGTRELVLKSRRADEFVRALESYLASAERGASAVTKDA